MFLNEATWEKWRRYTAFCKKHLDKLNDWEVAFIDDVDSMLEMNRELSTKRSFELNEIYHRLEEEVQ